MAQPKGSLSPTLFGSYQTFSHTWYFYGFSPPLIFFWRSTRLSTQLRVRYKTFISSQHYHPLCLGSSEEEGLVSVPFLSERSAVFPQKGQEACHYINYKSVISSPFPGTGGVRERVGRGNTALYNYRKIASDFKQQQQQRRRQGPTAFAKTVCYLIL